LRARFGSRQVDKKAYGVGPGGVGLVDVLGGG